MAAFDLIVTLRRTGSTVTVSGAWNHGLQVGDQLTIFQTACASGTCGFSVTDAGNAVQVSRVIDSGSFEYTPAAGAGEGEGYYRKVNHYAVPKLRRGNPFYYTIEAIEYCKDAALTDCQAQTAAANGYTVRYGRSASTSGRSKPATSPSCSTDTSGWFQGQ